MVQYKAQFKVKEFMMATYTWQIQKLYTKDITKNDQTYTDVIARVEASLTATSESKGSITSESGFDLDMNVDNIDSNFTTYSSVTEANVISWIESRVEDAMMANIKATLEGEIEYKEKIDGATPKEDADENAIFPWS